MTYALALTTLVFSVSFAQAAVETAQLKTPRGTTVSVALNLPENLRGKAPAVVIAPGAGYHMDLPIVRGLAEKLASEGVIAVRFNWSYFSADPQNGQASRDLSNEVEDMTSVVTFARGDARVSADRMILAGKSLGSIVAYKVFGNDPAARALLLLTPVCTASYDDNGHALPGPVPSGPRNYPGFSAVTKPVAMVLGSVDPLCSLPMLRDFLNDTKGNVTVDVIDGDHSWNVTKGTDPDSLRLNAENVAKGVSAAASRVEHALGK